MAFHKEHVNSTLYTAPRSVEKRANKDLLDLVGFMIGKADLLKSL